MHPPSSACSVESLSSPKSLSLYPLPAGAAVLLLCVSSTSPLPADVSEFPPARGRLARAPLSVMDRTLCVCPERLPGSGRGCRSLWDSSRIVCTTAFRPCAAEGVGVFGPDKRLASAPHLPRQPEELGLPTALREKGEARLLLGMGRKDFSYLFLAVFCTMALKLSCVSSMSVAGLGYVVTAVVLSAVVSDGQHN